jgi:anti-sigma factor RsiW
VNCKEFQELISAAVDLQLTNGELAAFKDHSAKCPPCRFEFEAEAATKIAIRARAHRVRTPSRVALQITERLGHEQSNKRIAWLTEFFRKPLVKPAFGFALAFVAVLLLLRGSTSDGPVMQAGFGSNDVILQSLKNYRAVVDGDIKPQLASSEPAKLASFFSDITDYSVHLPKMKDCRLVGGVQSEFAGTKLAHIMYKHNTEVVYIYQACWSTVMKGEKLCLPDEAKDELVRTGWFSATQPDGRTVVLWAKGRTLCAVVARMSKQDLIECLTSAEQEVRGW